MRAALVERLAASEEPVVVVRGGAGYGKTTLVRQWLEVDPRPVAWVTLDPGDDDPVVLLRYLTRALDAIEPLPDVLAALHGPSPGQARRALERLGSALSAGRAPFVLVLDDTQQISSNESWSVIESVVDSIPSGSRVVLVGRGAPRARVARRLLGGQVLELDQHDLTFTEEESRTVLRDLAPQLDRASADSVIEWTESWPAGLRLAALALRHRRHRPTLASLAQNRHLLEYLRDELLDQVPESVRTFLVHTSVLERLTPPLCDHVLERDDSATVLHELVSTGHPFVISLDDDEPSFRYHHVFAELLLAELRRSAPAHEATLRRRAARWLSDRQQADAAVRQAVAAGDVELAAGIIHRHTYGAIARGEIATLARWLECLPAEEVRRQPLLALSAGWLALARLDVENLAVWLDRVEHLAARPGLRVEVPGDEVDLAVAVSALRMLAGVGGSRRGLESAQVVRDAGPAASPWWGVSVLMEASARFALGEGADPVEQFSMAEAATRGAGGPHVTSLANLALAHLLRFEDERAEVLLRQASAEAAAGGVDDYVLSVSLHSVGALAAARRHDAEAARRAAAIAERLIASAGSALTRGALLTWLELAEAALLLGDEAAAARHLRRADELLPFEPDAVRFHEWFDRLRARLRRSGGVVIELTPAELRVLAHLPSHRSLAEIADHLYLSRNTVKSHTISIYRKLGVSGRSAAVERARELNLLES